MTDYVVILTNRAAKALAVLKVDQKLLPRYFPSDSVMLRLRKDPLEDNWFRKVQDMFKKVLNLQSNSSGDSFKVKIDFLINANKT
jgi:hypothetical protein